MGRAILTFGKTGGFKSAPQILPIGVASTLAANLSRTLGRNPDVWKDTADPKQSENYRVGVRCSRVSWSDSAHWVNVEYLP